MSQSKKKQKKTLKTYKHMCIVYQYLWVSSHSIRQWSRQSWTET